MSVLNEGRRLSNRQVVQINSMHAGDETDVSDHWRTF